MFWINIAYLIHLIFQVNSFNVNVTVSFRVAQEFKFNPNSQMKFKVTYDWNQTIKL